MGKVSRTPSAAEAGLARAFAPPSTEPTWLLEARAAALGRFTALGLPTAKHEDWRFTSLAALAAVPLVRAPAGDPTLARDLVAQGPAPEGPRLVFVNGRLDPALSTRAKLPQGAILASLAEALR